MIKFLNTSIKATILIVAVISFSTTVYADDVTDYIKEGLQYYKDGQYSDAVDSLNYAEQLIQQKKSAGLEGFLPGPLKGWKANKATSQAAGSAMFGGGISAEREYTKKSSSIKIKIVTDSPLLQSVMMMMSNPMFATSDGGKLERIGRQKGILKFDPNTKEGEMQIVVANRFLISIEGNDIKAKDLKDYAKAIDYNKLEKMK